MATHSSVLAWRIPGTGEPGGLPSMGSHRVGHDWSDLATAAAQYLDLVSTVNNMVLRICANNETFLKNKLSGDKIALLEYKLYQAFTPLSWNESRWLGHVKAFCKIWSYITVSAHIAPWPFDDASCFCNLVQGFKNKFTTWIRCKKPDTRFRAKQNVSLQRSSM